MAEENNRVVRKENHTTRIAEKSKKEFDDIKNGREKLGLKKLSYRGITSLIIRHERWPEIKEDIIQADEEDIE